MSNHKNSVLSYRNKCVLLAGIFLCSCEDSAFTPLERFNRDTDIYDLPGEKSPETEDRDDEGSGPGSESGSGSVGSFGSNQSADFWRNKYAESQKKVSFLKDLLAHADKGPLAGEEGAEILNQSYKPFAPFIRDGEWVGSLLMVDEMIARYQNDLDLLNSNQSGNIGRKPLVVIDESRPLSEERVIAEQTGLCSELTVDPEQPVAQTRGQSEVTASEELTCGNGPDHEICASQGSGIVEPVCEGVELELERGAVIGHQVPATPFEMVRGELVDHSEAEEAPGFELIVADVSSLNGGVASGFRAVRGGFSEITDRLRDFALVSEPVLTQQHMGIENNGVDEGQDNFSLIFSGTSGQDSHPFVLESERSLIIGEPVNVSHRLESDQDTVTPLSDVDRNRDFELEQSGVSGFQPVRENFVSSRARLIEHSPEPEEFRSERGSVISQEQASPVFELVRGAIHSADPRRPELSLSVGGVISLTPEAPEAGFESERMSFSHPGRRCLPLQLVTGGVLNVPASPVSLCLDEELTTEIIVPRVFRGLQEVLLPSMSYHPERIGPELSYERGRLISVERTVRGLSFVLGPVISAIQSPEDSGWVSVAGDILGQMPQRTIPEFRAERSEVYGQNQRAIGFISERGRILGQNRELTGLELVLSGVSGYQPVREDFVSSRAGLIEHSPEPEEFRSERGSVIGQEPDPGSFELVLSGVSGYLPETEDFVWARAKKVVLLTRNKIGHVIVSHEKLSPSSFRKGAQPHRDAFWFACSKECFALRLL